MSSRKSKRHKRNARMEELTPNRTKRSQYRSMGLGKQELIKYDSWRTTLLSQSDPMALDLPPLEKNLGRQDYNLAKKLMWKIYLTEGNEEFL